MKSKKILMMMLMALFSLSSCHDDTDMPTPSATHWTVSLVTSDDDSRHDPSLLSRYAAYESIIVSIIGLTDDTRTIAVTSDADWLTLLRDTLAADGIVTFTTTDNQTDQRRTATLTFADADHPELTGTLTLSQLSAADQDSNGEDAREVSFKLDFLTQLNELLIGVIIGFVALTVIYYILLLTVRTPDMFEDNPQQGQTQEQEQYFAVTQLK